MQLERDTSKKAYRNLNLEVAKGKTRTNCPYTAQIYRNTTNKGQKAEIAKKQ